MNDQDRLVKRVVELVENIDGFLVPLQSQANVQLDLYDELKNTLETYYNLIESSPQINRRLAGAMHEIIISLENTSSMFWQSKKNDAPLIDKMLYEMEAILEKLFFTGY